MSDPISRVPSDSEIQYGFHFMKYLKVAREHYGDSWEPTIHDIQHSSLLFRIRQGKEPFEKKPPTHYSSPWYAVVEDPGPHSIGEIFFHKNYPKEHSFYDSLIVSIDQEVYCLLEEKSPEDCIVGFPHHKHNYKFRVFRDVPKFAEIMEGYNPEDKTIKERYLKDCGPTQGWFIEIIPKEESDE